MILSPLLLLIWSFAICVTLWGTWYSLRQFNRPFSDDKNTDFGPVSILKPIKGADSGLRENLESFFRIDYPEYELIFCIADKNDPACETVQSLVDQYPDVRARLMVGDVPTGPNPKVNNIFRAYHVASFDLILISDSNTRVKPDYLKRLVSELSPGVGVLTSVVAGTNPQGVGGFLEAIYLNTFYARWMWVVAAMGEPCVIGKSMLFRRSVANKFGGIHVLGSYINEDYRAGKAVQSLGLTVKIVRDPIEQYIGEYSLRSFWKRHVRWGRIRKCQKPPAFMVEPLVSMLGSAVVGGLAFESLFQVNFWLFIVGHVLVWSYCDLRLASRLGGGKPLGMFFAWWWRELISLPLWLHVACGNTVDWRGMRLRLHSGGLLNPQAGAF